MNFFDEQDKRRKNTKKLVFLFLCAVAAIIAAIYTVIWFFHVYKSTRTVPVELPPFWDPKLFAGVAIGSLLVILAGSFYMWRQLGSGGRIVAERLGGRELFDVRNDPIERKLRNVVEEMAIASGTPVPQIYLLDGEHGINAFAAGYTVSDSAIGVTRGAVEMLSREQLQGVIAHEFSHILNGDMRLNMRLIAILHGILLIGLTGLFILRGSAGHRHFSMGRSRSRTSPAVLGLGFGLFVIGYVGVFFGKLIKSAVSRQREYLADASAVQFTRNPNGIAGALQKIGGDRWGSRVKNPQAEIASHMFISNALKSSMFSAMATHPPLQERIKLIDPSWDGAFPESRVTEALPGMETRISEYQPTPPASVPLAPEIATALTAGALAGNVIQQVGNPSVEHVAYAANFVSSLPKNLSSAVRKPWGAKAIIYALLLDEDEVIRKRQYDYLVNHAEPGLHEKAVSFHSEIQKLNKSACLPLVDLALPALRRLSREEYNMFGMVLKELVGADQKVSLFEFVLIKILKHHLRSWYGNAEKRIVQFYTWKPILPDFQILLSVLARAGHDSPEAAEKSFALGMANFPKNHLAMLPREQCGFGNLDRALDRLAVITPKMKERVMNACAYTVLGDEKVVPEEAELLRAVGDTLDCPLPPFLTA